jgi:hypothetical protein
MTILGRIFHQRCERETTLGRAVLGLLAGAATGGVLTSLLHAAVGVAGGIGGVAITWSVRVFAISFLIWLIGLVVIAGPGWWVLHRSGARCQEAAMTYGGGLTFVVLAMLSVGGANPAGLTGAAILAGVGVAVGWVVARVAYGKPAPNSG